MRKTTTLRIEKENRDQGKTFIVTEMSAFNGYDWASRVFFALLNAGVDVPDDMMQSGVAGIAALSGTDFARFVFRMLAKVPHYTAKPILDDLLKCAQIQMPAITRDLMDDDIEEISTILDIQKTAFNLHFDFFGAGGQSITGSVSQETAA